MDSKELRRFAAECLQLALSAGGPKRRRDCGPWLAKCWIRRGQPALSSNSPSQQQQQSSQQQQQIQPEKKDGEA